MKTINQILDKISQIRHDAMTTEIGEFRQKIIYLKEKHPKGGLLVPDDCESMKLKIEIAIKDTEYRDELVNTAQELLGYTRITAESLTNEELEFDIAEFKKDLEADVNPICKA